MPTKTSRRQKVAAPDAQRLDWCAAYLIGIETLNGERAKTKRVAIDFHVDEDGQTHRLKGHGKTMGAAFRMALTKAMKRQP